MKVSSLKPLHFRKQPYLFTIDLARFSFAISKILPGILLACFSVNDFK
jgi:hypothetical protein